MGDTSKSGAKNWTFLTNHAVVLIALARNPELLVREIAEEAGITERSAHSILAELADEGYVTIAKTGRRNTYEIHPEIAMRHPVARDRHIGEILAVLGKPPDS